MEAFKTPPQCFLFVIRDANFDHICKSESSARAGKIKAFVLLPSIIMQNHPEVYQSFIMNDVQVLHSSECPVLSSALQNNQVEVVELILTHSRMSIGLRVTVEVGNVALVKLILRKNVAVSKMKRSPSVICNAVDESSLELVETLLAAKANISYRNPRGGNLLHLAVLRNNVFLVKILLELGACVDLPRRDGSTPLHLAVQNGSDTIIMLLLEKGASVGAKKYDGATCFHLAIARKRERMFEVLLQHGATLPIDTHERLRLLSLAVQNNCSNIVVEMLSSGSYSAFGGVENDISSTLLLLAVEKQLSVVVERLLEYGVEVNTQSSDGRTVLQLAVAQESPEMVESILKHNCDLSEAKNETLLRELVLRDEEKFDKIVRILLRYGFTVDSKDENRIKLLHLALRNNYFELVQQLLDCGVNVNERYNDFDQSGHNVEVMPLIVAIRGGNENMISFLLAKGADVNDICGESTIPIFEAVEKSSVSVVKMLLDRGASVKYYPEILHNAVRRGVPDIVEVLLQHGLSPNAENDYDREEFTPVTIAALQNNLKMIDLLLKYGADINGNVWKCVTPLHFASNHGHLPIIEYLIRNGADINKKNADGCTPVGVAAEEKVVDLLLNLSATFVHKNFYVWPAFDLRYAGGSETLCRSRVFQGYLDHCFTNESLPIFEGICQLFEAPFARGGRCPHKFKKFYQHEKSSFKEFATELARHMIKREAAGLCCDRKIKMSKWYPKKWDEENFRKNCKAEIDVMKAQNVCISNISLYDILISDIDRLACFARNVEVAKILDAEDLCERFPIYVSIICCQLRSGTLRMKLLKRGAETFHSVTKKFARLPDEVVDDILGHLCNQEIVVFVNAVRPMDVELKRPADSLLY